MGNDAKRTPGKWRFTRARDASKDYAIWAKNERGDDVFDSSLLLAECYHVVGDKVRVDAEANAEFIVRAVNAYGELLAACEKALKTLNELPKKHWPVGLDGRRECPYYELLSELLTITREAKGGVNDEAR